jgi:trypsin
MKSSLSTVLSACVAASLLAVPLAASAAGTNPLREHVKAREAAIAQRMGLQPLDVAPEIVGGELAPPGAWPGLVGMMFADEPDNFFAQYCGGSLISPRHVLTAAHCADFVKAKEIEVLIGTQSLASGGTRVKVDKIQVHPRWDPDLLDHDVAVITLAEAVTSIKPVRFISSLSEEHLFAPAEKPVVAAGWGSTGSSYPTEVMQTSFPVVDHAACVDTYAPYDIPVTKWMMCTGTQAHHKAVCRGDSGSPLWARNANGKFRVQVGVVSWGIPCAYKGFPDAYGRLATLGGWVKRQIED